MTNSRDDACTQDIGDLKCVREQRGKEVGSEKHGAAQGGCQRFSCSGHGSCMLPSYAHDGVKALERLRIPKTFVYLYVI
jgi:hypothetical protein